MRVRTQTGSEKNPDSLSASTCAGTADRCNAQAGRWRAFDYEELINRDKASLDIFWLKDESLEESENLPEPDVIAREIAEDLQNALEQFQLITEDLGEENE